MKDVYLAQRIEDALTAQYALPGWDLCDEMQFAEDTREALQTEERWIEERARRRAYAQAVSSVTLR